MTAMNLTQESTAFENQAEKNSEGSAKSGSNRKRTIILVLIGIVAALGVTGWVWQERSAAQEAPVQASVTLPVYQSTIGIDPSAQAAEAVAPVEAVAEVAAPEVAAPVASAPVASGPVEAVALADASSTQPAAQPVEAESAIDAAPILARVQALGRTEASDSAPASASVSKPAMQAPIRQRSVVRAGGADLMSEPDGTLISSLSTGTSLQATERTADSSWIYVEADKGAAGWIAADQILLLNGKVLPVATLETAAPASALGNDLLGVDDLEMALIPAADTAEDTVAEPAADSPAAPRQPARVDNADLATATIALNGSRLNVRMGPSADYAIVGKAYPDDAYAVIGRNDEGTWVQIEFTEAAAENGWISAEFITLNTQLAELPIVDGGSIDGQASVADSE